MSVASPVQCCPLQGSTQQHMGCAPPSIQTRHQYMLWWMLVTTVPLVKSVPPVRCVERGLRPPVVPMLPALCCLPRPGLGLRVRALVGSWMEGMPGCRLASCCCTA